ncbi:phytoene/squalene synthase family protein [Thermoflavifilum thermophilum]|nr:phytoene/squalene synthase family protein [Thermoflavifilum thermophilum]
MKDRLALYLSVSQVCSREITQHYSTSFSKAIRLLHPDLRNAICAIYGFVRIADEIVDSFHAYNKYQLLKEFEQATYEAISQGISTNPVLQAFQQTVRRYQIPHHLIDAFFKSMYLDLEKNIYQHPEELNTYVYGSAEVVGLMCLCIFCEGDQAKYHQLQDAARALGSAFQKVNFLRDIQADSQDLKRCYFPAFTAKGFLDKQAKCEIEKDIEEEFALGLQGIRFLPSKARFGVYVAYRYFYALFKKIKRTNPEKIMQQRIRIPNHQKLIIMLRASIRHQINGI